MSSLISPWPRIPTRPLVAKGIATTSAAPSTASSAPARTTPEPALAARAGSTARGRDQRSPAAIAAVVPCPGSLTAMPQTTSSAERPAAGATGE